VDLNLFNIVQKLRDARDLIVSQGPQTILTACDLVHRWELTAREVAAYIASVGPLVQFGTAGPGGEAHALDTEAQAHLAEIQSIHAELEAVAAKCDEDATALAAEHQRQLEVGVQAGLMDWINRMDPALKAQIVNLFLDLIGRVLTKSGAAPTGAAKATGRRRKKGE